MRRLRADSSESPSRNRTRDASLHLRVRLPRDDSAAQRKAKAKDVVFAIDLALYAVELEVGIFVRYIFIELIW